MTGKPGMRPPSNSVPVEERYETKTHVPQPFESDRKKPA